MSPEPAIQPQSALPPWEPQRPAEAVERADSLADLTRIFAPRTQICLHSRPSTPELLDAVATLKVRPWTGLHTVLRLNADRFSDTSALPLPPSIVHPALRRDLAFLVELYSDLLGCSRIGLRIERLERAMCPGWHVDRTGIRLLCTWSGPGTEWLDDPRIDLACLPSSAAGAAATGQAQPFDIVLLKGRAWQGNAAAGAAHRSPEVAPGSGPRLLVALDALWDD
jgi:hypothetical protein